MSQQTSQILAGIKAELLRAVGREGARIVSEIQADVPVDPQSETPGLLRDSTFSEAKWVGNRLRLTIYNTAPYAAYEEFGHLAPDGSSVPANAFMARSQARERDFAKKIAGG